MSGVGAVGAGRGPDAEVGGLKFWRDAGLGCGFRLRGGVRGVGRTSA